MTFSSLYSFFMNKFFPTFYLNKIYKNTKITQSENSAEGLSLPITTRARGASHGIVDAKLHDFFKRAKEYEEKLSALVLFHLILLRIFKAQERSVYRSPQRDEGGKVGYGNRFPRRLNQSSTMVWRIILQ